MIKWIQMLFSRKKLNQVLFALFILFFQIFQSPQIVGAQILEWGTRNPRCVETVSVGDGAEVDVATIQGFECLLGNVLGAATTFIGLASFVMIIIGAFLYLTSGGNTKGTEAAKQTITYAIIGIVVSLMAYFILNFVAIFTGVRGILEFNLNIGQ